MSRPIPLMFLHHSMPNELFNIVDEESTTIFQQDDHDEKEHQIQPGIQQKLQRLSTPFGRRVYQNLTFVTTGSMIMGNIIQLDDILKQVHVQVSQQDIVVVHVKDILDIQWRGKSLPNT